MPQLTLTQAHVWKYKSIDDSTPVKISEDVTVLVGKNESGKTAFLEALYKALPHDHDKAQFDVVFDYPKREYVKYRAQHDAKEFARVVELGFSLSRDLADKINKEVFGGEKIIGEGHSLTRWTNYGNGNNIGFTFDNVKALNSLRKTLGSVEHADEVFKDAIDLQQVLSNIESKSLAADSSLAAFAKEWRSRISKIGTNWGTIDWHIWNKYLRDALPGFLYFDDYRLLQGKINLESLNQRKNNNQLTESDETALGLFELAGISLPELMSEEGYENSKAKLEAIGLSITEQVFEFWTQNQEKSGALGLAVEFDVKADPKDQPPFNNGKNLYIRVKNLKHGVTVPFDQRSKGFIWFFSFMAWFSAIENRLGTQKDVILLLDEPGLNLHALAQKDFLNYINALAAERQILYSTHSPFMVETERLDRVRVVEDRAKEGSRIAGELQGSSDESLFPLQAALGYSIAQNLFIAKKNVLLEGPADLLILQHMSALLEQMKKTSLKEGILVPVGGLDKVATFVALLGANKLHLVVLHDRGSKAHQGLENLIQQKLIEKKRVLDYSIFRTPENLETDIEDLIPEKVYVEAFNSAYAKELPSELDKSQLPKHPRTVERINSWLKANKISLLKDGGFNHYRVAQALLPLLNEGSVDVQIVETFDKLFTRLNNALT